MIINTGEKCQKEGAYKCTKCGNEIKLNSNQCSIILKNTIEF